jgi:hypothetical protein
MKDVTMEDNNCITEGRIGRVYLSRELRRLPDSKLIPLYAQLGVIIRLEDMFYNDITELIVANPSLLPVPQGSIIPEYDLHFDQESSKLTFIQKPNSDIKTQHINLRTNEESENAEGEIVI